MRLGLGLQINCTASSNVIGDKYEFDNRFWSLIGMKWETINDTWEEEI